MYIDKVDVDESPSYSYSPLALALALAKCFGFVLFEKYELVGEVFWVREFLLLVWVACLLSRSHTNIPYCLDLAADAGLGPLLPQNRTQTLHRHTRIHTPLSHFDPASFWTIYFCF